LGNVWRLDLTPSSGTYAAPTQIATLTDASGAAQPVTIPPLIEIQPNAFKRYVLIGTGQLLSISDVPSTQTQTFYSIIDGTSGSGTFYTSTTLPAGVTFPISRSNLIANTDVTTAIVPDSTKLMGWYFDLTAGDLINVPLSATSGLVAFAANTPSGSVCSASGSNKVYAVNFATGKSVLTDALGYSTAIPGMITDVQFYNYGGKLRLQVGNTQNGTASPSGTYSSGDTLKRLNWREVPTSD